MSENKNNKDYSSLAGFNRAIPIILLALAAFIALCFITQQTGALGKIISGVLLGLFAKGAYLIPVLLALHAIFFSSDVAEGRIVSRFIFSVTALLSVSAVLYTIANIGGELSFDAAKFYNDGVNGNGGGFIGSSVAFGIIKIFGHVGLIIIAIVILALYITFFFAKGRGAAKRSIYGVLLAFFKFCAKIENRIVSFFESLKKKKSEKVSRATKERTDELLDDEFFAVDNGLKSLSISQLGIREERSDRSLEENPTLQSKVHHKSAEENYKPKAAEKQSYVDNDWGFHGASERKFNENDIIYEDSATSRNTMSERAAYGLDCSADEIFTKSFSPIDFALDSAEKDRPSSKGPAYAAKTPETELRESVRAIPEWEIEMARKKADLDMKRASNTSLQTSENNDGLHTRERYDMATEFINGVNAEYTSSVQMPNKAPEADTRAESSSAFASAIFSTPSADGHTVYKKTERKESTYSAFSSQDSVRAVYTEVPKKEEAEVYASATERIFVAEEKREPAVVFSVTENYAEDEEDTLDNGSTERLSFSEHEPKTAYETESEIPAADSIDLTRTMFSPTPGVLELIPEEEEAKIELDEQSEEKSATEDGGVTFAEEKNPTPAKNLYTYSDSLGDEASVDYPKEDDTHAEDDTAHEIIQAPKSTEKKPKRPDYSSYKYPPLEILAKGESLLDDTLNDEMEENGNKIIETLASFNVLASIKGYDRGPRITRYEVVPSKGVRVNQVVNLFDDIALSLAAEGIRIEAPIPGKSAIGFELPNKTPETVRLRDLIECDEFKNAPSKTLACIGKDVTGSPVFGDIAKMPHVLIAGATGMGKSVCINSILISILYRARPDEVKFILIDPKKVEFKMYNGIPHLLVPVVSDPKQAAGALMWAVEEMERRYDAIEALSVRNIEGYNEKVRENPKLGEPLPKLIIVIDELNDLMLQVKDPVEGLIMSISQKARAAGIHLIIGTQRPSVNVITGVIKANIPSRMSCKVASYTDSKTIIERSGAERLLDKGDMLYHPVGTPKPVRVQSAFVSDSEVYAVMDALRENKDMVSYDDKVIEDIARAAQKCVKSKGGASMDEHEDGDGGTTDISVYMRDKQFLAAVDIAVSSGKVSTSLIQRRIGVGYSKAAKFIDVMEEMHIVSEPNGQKPRETLITKEDWQEKLASY